MDIYMFTQEQEVKRSKEWKVVMAISSILIIVIAVFFLFRMFHSNPLEGTWVNEENDMTLKIKGGTTMVMEVPGALDGNDMELQLKYTIDRSEKMITIEVDDAEIQKALDNSDGTLTEETVKNEADQITSSYDYSVEQDEMTLTEREYGDQLTFVRIIQRIYIAVRHRTDRSTYLLRFPDGAFHAPYHRADLLVDGTFPA